MHQLDASRSLADIVTDLTAIASRPMTTSVAAPRFEAHS